MINCNENENIDQDVDIETNTENVVCLFKTMSLCNKQTFEYQFIKKLRNTEAELKKSFAYKKIVYSMKL